MVESLNAACFLQIVPWFSFSVPGALHLGLLSISTGLALFCLLAAVINDPGSCASPFKCRPRSINVTQNRARLSRGKPNGTDVSRDLSALKDAQRDAL